MPDVGDFARFLKPSPIEVKFFHGTSQKNAEAIVANQPGMGTRPQRWGGPGFYVYPENAHLATVWAREYVNRRNRGEPPALVYGVLEWGVGCIDISASPAFQSLIKFAWETTPEDEQADLVREQSDGFLDGLRPLDYFLVDKARKRYNEEFEPSVRALRFVFAEGPPIIPIEWTGLLSRSASVIIVHDPSIIQEMHVHPL